MDALVASHDVRYRFTRYLVDDLWTQRSSSAA
jgi:hypothetical protein